MLSWKQYSSTIIGSLLGVIFATTGLALLFGDKNLFRANVLVVLGLTTTSFFGFLNSFIAKKINNKEKLWALYIWFASVIIYVAVLFLSLQFESVLLLPIALVIFGSFFNYAQIILQKRDLLKPDTEFKTK